MKDRQIVQFLISAIAIYIGGAILPGVDVSNMFIALVLAVILGLLNNFVKPVLVFFSLPVTFLTFGLFLVVVNGAMIYLAYLILPGFDIRSFWYAILYSLVLSVLQYMLDYIFGVRTIRKPRKKTT